MSCGYSNNLNAALSKISVAIGIRLGREFMSRPVKFDCQPALNAVEIYDPGSNRDLAPDFESKLLPSELVPQRGF
jgi:hypothetical protein